MHGSERRCVPGNPSKHVTGLQSGGMREGQSVPPAGDFDLLQWSIYAVEVCGARYPLGTPWLQRLISTREVCGLLVCAHNTTQHSTGVASHGPIRPVGWGASLEPEEPTPPAPLAALYARLPVGSVGWGVYALGGIAVRLRAVWLVSRGC